MRRLQRSYLNRIPEHKREEATRSFYKHDVLARRIGLSVVTGLVQIIIAAVAITVLYRFALEAINREWLILPPSAEQFREAR